MKFKMTPDYLNMRLNEDLEHSNFLLIERFIDSLDVDKRIVFYRFEGNGEFIKDKNGEIVYDYDETKDYNLEKFKLYHTKILIEKATNLLRYKTEYMWAIFSIKNRTFSTGNSSTEIEYLKGKLIENEFKTGNVWGNIISFSNLIGEEITFFTNIMETSMGTIDTTKINDVTQLYSTQLEKLMENQTMRFEINKECFRPKEELILHNPDFTPEKKEELEKIPVALLLNPFLFVHDLYCGVLDIPVHIYIRDGSLFDDKKYVIIGMCDGSKITSKPKNNTYGVMLLDKDGTTFWCHVTKSEALKFFKKERGE